MCKSGGQGRWDAAVGGQLETEVPPEQATRIKGMRYYNLRLFTLRCPNFFVDLSTYNQQPPVVSRFFVDRLSMKKLTRLHSPGYSSVSSTASCLFSSNSSSLWGKEDP